MKKLSIDFNEMPYAIEEAMNRLRINIKFCGKNTKKLLITSSLPNEGKSTISINLEDDGRGRIPDRIPGCGSQKVCDQRKTQYEV